LYCGASTLILLILFSFEQFSISHAVAGIQMMPGFLLGYWVANHFTPHLDRGGTRIAVLGVSAAAAVTLIVRSLLS
jgi:hypothetical protein